MVISGPTAMHLGQSLAPMAAEQKESVVPGGENRADVRGWVGGSPGMQHVQIKTGLRLPTVPVWCAGLLQALSLPRATNSTDNKGANAKMSPF